MKSPSINFDADSKKLDIFGRSWPENAIATYEKVFAWIDTYFETNDEAHVTFSLEYFNTSSSKIILDIIKTLEKHHTAGKKITTDWFYESDDDDAKEDGEVLNDSTTLPIEMKSIEEFEFSFV